MTWQGEFDPSAPPTLIYNIIDSDRPHAVCTWRWWGPRPEYDVLGWVVIHKQELVLERFYVVPYGSFVDENGRIDVAEDADVAEVLLPITPSLLREIPLARLMAQIYADLTRRAPTADPDEQWARHVLTVAEAARAGGPDTVRRRGALSDALLRQVAEVCIEEAQGGRGLWRRVGERLGEPESRVRDLVRAARARGYLSSEVDHGKRDVKPGQRLLNEIMQENMGDATL